MLEITEKQYNQIARSICVLDIKAYIEQHKKEYEKFLEENAKSKK